MIERILKDSRFQGITPFENHIYLSSPTIHGEEQDWVDNAIKTNWVSTIGENINEIERMAAEQIGRKYAVALSTGTAALHFAIKLCGEKIYGRNNAGQNSLLRRKVFASDMTFVATVNPIVYEGGKPVLIDAEYDTWNMDPEALEKAFELYPEVKLVVLAHLFGVPGKIDEIKAVCTKHNAMIVEDAAESFGATYKGVQTGSFGTESIISFNGNKIITGSSGGMFLTDDQDDAKMIRKWSTQARENAPWYQHEEIGYNYRISNVTAGVIRGQFPYLEEHIAQKRAIYYRYKEGLKDLPVQMNPFEEKFSVPNYWLSCMLIDKDAMCQQKRGNLHVQYISEPGKSCPTEILEALAAFNVEGRPIWKPMHMQPIYRKNAFITKNGEVKRNASVKKTDTLSVDEDIFARGLCLPSDNKMTIEHVDKIIDIIHRCFE